MTNWTTGRSAGSMQVGVALFPLAVQYEDRKVE